MKVTEANVEQFINRFMNGETSNEEEAALYRFFQEDAVPEKLKVYKPMFAYFAGGMKEEDLPLHPTTVEFVPAKDVSSMEPVHNKKGGHLWKRFIIPLTAGIAACFIGVAGFIHYEKQQELYNSYSGSYVIEHGKRLSDIRAIMPELKRVEAHAEEADSRHQIGQVTKAVLSGIADPEVRAAAAEVLK